jgi:CheY-like chemotaxis protein
MLIDIYADELGNLDVQIENVRYAMPALKEFTTKQYPLIIMDVEITPGTRSEESTGDSPYARDRRIEDIMAQSRIKYHEIGIYVLTEARRHRPNARTPILVASHFHPITDDLFPNAARTCREAGATEYVDIDETPPSRFREIVRTYLTKQR